jgi:site-specific recombinase XerD
MAPVGIDVRTVQESLDHESLATTQKYLEGNGKALEEMRLPF